MKSWRLRPNEGRRSEIPRTNLLPGAGQHAQTVRKARGRFWLLLLLVLCFLVLLGLTLLT